MPARVVDMLDFQTESLAQIRFLLVITSTYGNGDPPSNAEALHAFLMKTAPPLPELHFSVCGLGDTTYDRFAQCGKDFDRRLGELGATRLAERQDCDVDYEASFEAWFDKASAALQVLRASSSMEGEIAPPQSVVEPVSRRHDPPGTRRNPVPAVVLENVNLNGPGSTKETRHLVLSTEGLPFSYEAGDSIGLWSENQAELVDAILRVTGLSGDEVAAAGSDDDGTIRDLLTRQLEIQAPDVRLIDRVLETRTPEERQAVGRSHHVLDLLAQRELPWTARELAQHLRPLAPRLYSIASSPLAHPGAVHLLVDIVRYQLHGTERMGVASRFVTERAQVGAKVPIYLHPSPSFRIASPEQDMIMIGPGTGVAPFRAFLQERLEGRASAGKHGRSWLFFGSRRRQTDFLYERDMGQFQRDGVLSRLDLAFSRDTAEKVYVQHRMLEAKDELYAWIKGGALIYVCGDAKRMAPDVHETLREILTSVGAMDEASATLELQQMSAAGRYKRDVY